MNIEIHEFSTGIRPQQTTDGSWVSLGFTGKYMNVTIDPIPEVVERSIANREFAVAEGASSDQPAIIGRVLGTGENTWSVVAVVTRGRDEKGRSASMYRYFITQGSESEGFKNLRLILAWWESQKIPPRFNPFDTRELRRPNICDVNVASTNFRSPPLEAIEIPVDTPQAILLPPQQQYDLQTINSLASKKYNANKNGQALSWAFNVEALEKPERFLVIQSASDRAYQILQKAISNTPNVLAPANVTDEEALKSAIRGLMNSSQVKPENVKVITDALANKQITSEYWHSLFDGQGSKTAISQKIYSPQMVRLITLRAMVIPETILEFLDWLNIKAGQKPDENQTISLEFQKAIRNNFTKNNLADTIKFLLTKLLEEPAPITPEAIHWLLVGSGSAWVYCRQKIIQDISDDLQLIFNSFKDKTIASSDSYRCDPQTWKSLNQHLELIYSNSSSIHLEEYDSFAKLFESLKEYSLSAYFYQVSQGIVPRKVFDELPNNNTNCFEFGLRLDREVTFIDQIIYFVFYWRYSVQIQIVIVLSMSIAILSFVSGLIVEKTYNILSRDDDQNSIAKNSDKNTKNVTNPIQTKPPYSSNPGNYSDIQLNASQKFNTTKKAIEIIIKNTNQKTGKSKLDIIKKLKFILNAENVNYADTRPSGGTETNQFIEAIYQYQKTIFPEEPKKWDGIIGPNGETAKNLEEDVKNELINQGSNLPTQALPSSPPDGR
ncbi:hypothetical protein H6G80_21690 [Nostoc sp. FACHB-87]|uniref:hypothetical protein n=1 Tax=Nostocaceae TaxID=1162 RepID=UPI00168278E4|nr:MULTISPECIES: hypothetical protein [Nostocaceae]MBD2456679.1 hypothetical protein [Nostoc sp. FACHB-87]MBD2478067.1 hypothetical protein [Anabaena sp. FACHB-83]